MTRLFVFLIFHLEREIFMIPDHTPGIRSIADELYDFERFGSLVDEISDKIKIVLWGEVYFFAKCYEFIITAMDITDEESSFHILFLGIGNVFWMNYFLFTMILPHSSTQVRIFPRIRASSTSLILFLFT
jgi:hypothetical protein